MNAASPAMTAEGPPPVNHTIKPHHVHILRIIQVLFIVHQPEAFPPTFMLNVHRVLMMEIAEVRQAATCAQLMDALEDGGRTAPDKSREAIQEIMAWRTKVDRPECFFDFFKDFNKLVPVDDEDESSKFTRRSLFGYFVRRCMISFSKLAFEAVENLFKNYWLWVDGKYDENTAVVQKNTLRISYNVFKTPADKKEYAQPEAYALWEHGLAVGDEMIATENLRRFFEQHFHELNDSGVRQHALLNLARMNFLRHQYAACRKLLQEAITTARSNGDKNTLQHCIGLINRLPPIERGARAVINEIQVDLHPMEVLYDTKKLLTISYNQPLATVFEKIWEATALYDHWSNVRKNGVTDAEQWGVHAVQSVTWEMLGVSALADIEDQVVMAFTESGGPDNTRLVVTLNHAYRMARQGFYKEAISTLLNPSVWSGLIMTDYQLWAAEIWHILVLRASRRGQKVMYDNYLAPSRPDGLYGPRCYWPNSSKLLNSPVRDPLYDVIALREVKQAHTAVEPLLTAVWHAEFLQRFDLYRAAIVLLADGGLEFGLTQWCGRLIDEILPQVISGCDAELRALACFTRARCLLATKDTEPQSAVMWRARSVEDHERAIQCLDMAESDYRRLEMYTQLEDVYCLKAVIWQDAGDVTKRDEAAQKHQETVAIREKVESEVTEEWVMEIWDLVADVGCALAAR